MHYSEVASLIFLLQNWNERASRGEKKWKKVTERLREDWGGGDTGHGMNQVGA